MRPNEFLLAVIHLSAFVSGHIYVEQQPGTEHRHEGENVNLSCHIRTDEGEKIIKFHVEWYREGADKQLHEVENLFQLKGRLHENTNSNQQSASLSLFTLEPSDTGKYFCNFFFLIDQKILQHNGNGTRLFVQELVTSEIHILSTTDKTCNNTMNNTDADTENITTENDLPTVLISLPLSLKFVAILFICFYTLFSYTSVVLPCSGPLRNVT